MKFLKQVLAIAAGVFLGISLIIYVLIAMASHGMKQVQQREEKARAEAEENWNNMVKNGLHPGLNVDAQPGNNNQEEN